jgi:exodeoxyribonuclease VII small subunit
MPHPTEKPEISYSQAMERLQALLDALEGGKLDIDQMLAHVTEAEALVSYCRTRLRDATGSMEELLSKMKAHP